MTTLVLLCRPEDLVASRRAALKKLAPGEGFEVITTEDVGAGAWFLMKRSDYADGIRP